MTPRGWSRGWFGRWRHNHQELDDAFIEICLSLWDQGKDTKEIAELTQRTEAVCERHLRIGRERRRLEEGR